MKLKLIVLIISIAFTAPSQATIISTSIPALTGEYKYMNDPTTVSFDLGVHFSSITSVSLKFTAQGLAGNAYVCITVFDCSLHSVPPNAYYQFSSDEHLIIESGVVAVDSTGWSVTATVLSETDQFLDGKGTFLLAQAQLLFHDHFKNNGNNGPLLFIKDASIVIDGVVASAVPVPSAVWLFGSGFIGLIGMKKKLPKSTILSA